MQPSPEIVAHLNAVANDPSVRPHIVCEGTVDMAATVAGAEVFTAPGAAIIFHPVNPALWQFHSMATLQARGRGMRNLARRAALEMFTRSPALILSTFTPASNPLATPPKSFGFRGWFGRETAVRGEAATWYKLHVEDWALRSPECRAAGQAFHDQFHDAVPDAEHHAYDPAHNAMVGLAILCCKAGQVDKGLMLYNAWAGCAGYHRAVTVSLDPLTVFTGDAHWTLRGDRLEVSPCP